MKTLFHITPRRRLANILLQGLRPNVGHNGITCGRHVRKPQPVFLTDNLERIIYTQLTESWIRSNHPVILEVDVEGLDVNPWMTRCYEEGKNVPISHEFVVSETIPPARIRLIGHVEWSESIKERYER